MGGEIVHRPVMPAEVIGSLGLKAGAVVLDGTVGGGAHAAAMAAAVMPGGRLIGIDADPAAVERSRAALGAFGGQATVVHGNYRDLDTILDGLHIDAVDAVLLDLGVSSFQFDDGDRGFSLRFDGPLDMRMDTGRGTTARDLVNRLTEADLDTIISSFGEERFHRRVARAIVWARQEKTIETTTELAEIIRRSVGARYRHQKIDPATRTFQALRIAVNDELGALTEGLGKALRMLRQGGRIAVISFHSLEDRIVKNIFRQAARDGAVAIITKKPLVPTVDECVVNPRARSAKLRVAEKIAREAVSVKGGQ